MLQLIWSDMINSQNCLGWFEQIGSLIFGLTGFENYFILKIGLDFIEMCCWYSVGWLDSILAIIFWIKPLSSSDWLKELHVIICIFNYFRMLACLTLHGILFAKLRHFLWRHFAISTLCGKWRHRYFAAQSFLRASLS